jgi:hypothetical protein
LTFPHIQASFNSQILGLVLWSNHHILKESKMEDTYS